MHFGNISIRVKEAQGIFFQSYWRHYQCKEILALKHLAWTHAEPLGLVLLFYLTCSLGCFGLTVSPVARLGILGRCRRVLRKIGTRCFPWGSWPTWCSWVACLTFCPLGVHISDSSATQKTDRCIWMSYLHSLQFYIPASPCLHPSPWLIIFPTWPFPRILHVFLILV